MCELHILFWKSYNKSQPQVPLRETTNETTHWVKGKDYEVSVWMNNEIII